MAKFITVTGYKGERVYVQVESIYTISDAVKPADLDEEDSAAYDEAMQGIGCIITVSAGGDKASLPVSESFDEITGRIQRQLD